MSGWIECATPGCPGDMRYAAPGRGHIPGCTAPVTASDARPPSDTGTTLAFIRALVNAWDCCGTCAGGVLAARDRERDARLAALAGQEQP